MVHQAAAPRQTLFNYAAMDFTQLAFIFPGVSFHSPMFSTTGCTGKISFHYFKIAENEFPEETLKALNSLTSHLFMIETGDVKKIGEVVEGIKELLGKEVDPMLTRSLGIWLRRFFEKKKIDIYLDIETMSGKEVRMMLEAKLQEFEDEAFKRGELRGEMRGERKGRLIVAKAMLQKGTPCEEVKQLTGLTDEELNLPDSEIK